jgi:hypothetical protein
MTRLSFYLAPMALIGLLATEATATPAGWSGSVVRNLTAAGGADFPLILVQRRGGGGGAVRGGGGGVNRAGAGGGNFNSVTVNRNVNVSGRGYSGPGWGGVAAGVAVGAVVGSAAARASTPAYPSSYCPYPNYPNCGL